jgi:proteasome lid subunit RPN8/RPN11
VSSEVVINRNLLTVILESARAVYPRETILLLRGKTKKGRTEITDIVIPPLATHGQRFSGFPTHMLPMDFSIIGSAHSHPSGVVQPSVEDLNHIYGRIMMILAYPFRGEEDVGVFDQSGERVPLALSE